MAGIVVLSIGICAPDSMVLAHPESFSGRRQKEILDSLHKRKIDMASEILVLNADGYVGDSTRSEISHAKALGRPVRWLFQDLVPSEYSK
jgi:hypothetical protein